jgi:hypothetical protein
MFSAEALAAKTTHLKEKLAKLEEMAKLAAYEKQMLAVPDQQISLSISWKPLPIAATSAAIKFSRVIGLASRWRFQS